MRVENQPGWILHARPYRETSLLLEGFSREYGRIGLVARGVRRDRPRMPRALMQALVPISLNWVGQGELVTLSAIEARGQPAPLAGDALICAMYLNELLIRLMPRQDPFHELFDRYAETLPALADAPTRAWNLRRFERDLLGEIGYGIGLECDADSGDPLAADCDYAYIPEHGPVAWSGQKQALRLRGSALLALAEDQMPDAADLADLRRLLRALISHQLGGASLQSWSLMRVGSPPPPR